MKYANHEAGAKRFFRFQNFVISSGYLEKKQVGSYEKVGRQDIKGSLLLHENESNAKSASSF